jgi:hypothetical protein
VLIQAAADLVPAKAELAGIVAEAAAKHGGIMRKNLKSRILSVPGTRRAAMTNASDATSGAVGLGA